MGKEVLGITKDYVAIFINERTKEHMSAHTDVNLDVVSEAISTVKYDALLTQFLTVDMGRVIGVCSCVNANITDSDVTLLYRKSRFGPTPVTFNRKCEPTRLITFGIRLDEEDCAPTLITAYYGAKAPKEPWDIHTTKDEYPESIKFWTTHALVCGTDEIDWEKCNESFFPVDEDDINVFEDYASEAQSFD